ncbi:cobalt ECF transporter T component CbiQ [Massilia sp. 9096]|uniref:cobalt ECF transporter T component CbiQ n=1 Tax=Massilia sp. 9096 TaxID=1500894 RepID=UPI0005687370|nr:cobalt ECF transporter T component CbiQ [Massilia sp. 9096]
MRIEAAAYASRWLDVAPSAKALLALAGVGAAWIAAGPGALALLALLLMQATLLGARVPVRTYFGVLLAPLGFLLLSCLTMLVSPGADGAWHWNAAMLPTVARSALRSLAVLAALLGLTLTTPMPDLFALLRRLRTPELLLDLMALCYRMLFVLRQAWDDGVTAQQARLGYGGWRHGWRSMALLIGQMAVQVWQRAAALQMAADARAYQGTLRFLPADFPRARRQNRNALLAGAALLAIALADRWGAGL